MINSTMQVDKLQDPRKHFVHFLSLETHTETQISFITISSSGPQCSIAFYYIPILKYDIYILGQSIEIIRIKVEFEPHTHKKKLALFYKIFDLSKQSCQSTLKRSFKLKRFLNYLKFLKYWKHRKEKIIRAYLKLNVLLSSMVLLESIAIRKFPKMQTLKLKISMEKFY